MDQHTWNRLTEAERAAQRSLGGLTCQLTGLEGWRVEVITYWGDRERGIVSRSAGWCPCHILLKRRDSISGYSAPSTDSIALVRKLYRVR